MGITYGTAEAIKSQQSIVVTTSSFINHQVSWYSRRLKEARNTVERSFVKQQLKTLIKY